MEEKEQNIPTDIPIKKGNSKKKIMRIILFLLINVAVIVGLILIEDKNGDLSAGAEAMRLFAKNWYFCLIAFGLYFVIIAGDSIVFYSLTKKMNIKDNVGISIKVSILGRYYDRITPWSMGGEPFQMGYLINKGVGAGDACAITMSRHIIRFFSVATVVIAILVGSRITTNIWVMTVAIISVLGGLIVPVFMILCCVKPKIGAKLTQGIVKILYKLKWVKDYETAVERWQKNISEFLKGIEYLSANKQMIFIIALMAIIELFANNSAPYFIMRGLGIKADYWHILVLCIFVSYASSFAPTPGGAGIAELSFYAIFATVIEGNMIFWAVLMWRIAVFYMPLLLGFVLQIFEGIFSIFRNSISRKSER